MMSNNSSEENNSDNNFVDEIQDHLLCSICFRVFKKPVVLACCGQTLCEECLLNFMQSMGSVSSIGDGRRQSHNCPMCRSCVNMSYIKNVTIEDIVQSIKARGTNNVINNTTDPVKKCIMTGHTLQINPESELVFTLSPKEATTLCTMTLRHGWGTKEHIAFKVSVIHYTLCTKIYLHGIRHERERTD